jgi:capsular exopolysaccharide synthesis family protein
MSRIFDALKLSESKHAGLASPTLSDGLELLNQAERRILSSQEGAGSLDTPEGVCDDARGTMPKTPLASTAYDVGGAISSGAVSEGRDTFSQFQSLPMSIREDSRLVCLASKGSPADEAMRLLAVRLRNIRRSRPLKNVLITSTIPREGKSTIAANLACTLARKAEEKVLLIEGDVRLPALMQMFGIGPKPGLCDFLSDETSLSRSVYHVAEAGLWVIPAGTSPSNPLEALQSHKLPLLMEELSRFFDWIIIDSPPVLPLADTSIWMRLADGALLVTRQEVTEKRQLQKGLEALESKKMLGAIVNGSHTSRYSNYYYYGSS